MNAPTLDKRPTLDQLCINTIRTLSIDAVQQANSGHPGAPMGLAPVAYSLWQYFLQYDTADPLWPNRDRFVLSAGHASMLLYSILHLAGVRAVNAKGEVQKELSVSLDEIKRFRQIGSRTPGHPESHLTTGVETTTGPLGQGAGNSVGMAIAGKWLAANFNRPGFELFNFRVFTICGDGDLMEGVSNESASIAGHLGLSNLIWFYDNNHITIEGNTSLAFSDDVGTRFMGWHWNVQHVSDVNDLAALDWAIREAQKETQRPSLIIVNSHIGYGSPHKQDTAEAHGEALGVEEVRLTKINYGWPPDAQFLVPEEVKSYMGAAVPRAEKWEQEWNDKYKAWAQAFPDFAKEWKLIAKRDLPQGWDKDIPTFPADAKGIATRESNSKVLNAVAKNVPWLIGGAADLAPSTKTLIKDAGSFERGEYDGRNFHFGIREHAMGAIVNGMTLSLIRAYGSTFFIFTDYMRPTIRLAALMDIPAIFIYTHDSIGLGEDGPTHQPIEQLMSLRAMPRLLVFRPGDANEVSETWRCIMRLKHEPVVMALTRQALPTIDRTKYASASGVAKGAYVLSDSGGMPEVILIGTGSEVQLCIGAYEKLAAEGIKTRVVSIPCWELFDRQSAEYRAEVLPPAVRARVAVEAGATLGWERYVGDEGEVVGHDGFGASAPIKDLMSHFGFTVDNVVAKARAAIANVKS